MLFLYRLAPGTLAGLALVSLSAPLAAQQAASCLQRLDNPASTTFARDAARLPVDRIADLLALSPGVSALNLGGLSVRGAGQGANGTYLDGVPVIPGWRGLLSPTFGGSYYGETGAGLGVGTNAFEQVTLSAGLMSAELGNARGGIIQVETASCAEPDGPRLVSLRGGLASDAILGASNGIGFNRVTMNGEGRFGRLVVGAAAIVEGQRTARLGLEQNESPVYLADGIDTTITFNDGATDRTVDILRFRPSDGIRIPSSAATTYTLSGRVAYFLGSRNRVQLSGHASQLQQREFNYQDLYNPRQTFGERDWSEVLTGSWFGRLKQSEALTLSAEAHLSLQWNHATRGPFSTSGEADTRDPSTGLMLSPFDFRFDGSNFPVNEELVNNFRTNSGRLSPYDLTNTTPYQLIDRYRNNPYGLSGFTESGGPVGTLSIFEEKRLVGKGVVTAEWGARHRLRAGIEATRFDVSLYSSGLTIQSFAEAYIESPKQGALFGEYQLTLSDVTVSAGLRYDHFSTGASRPDFPRISSAPGFDPDSPTAQFVADKGHSRLSPRLFASVQATPRVRVYGGVSALAQVPDFATSFAGINTDLSTTNMNHVFGTDLDFQRSVVVEGGVNALVDDATTVGGGFWIRRDADLVVAALRPEFDPFTLRTSDIRRFVNDDNGHGSTQGVDLRLTRRLGDRGQAWLSYGLVSPGKDVAPVSRKHNIAVAALYETSPQSTLLGGILRRTGVYATFRAGSGTKYTRCPESDADDAGVLSGEVCTRSLGGELNGASLPMFKVIDLRVTRTFSLGGADLVAFADARNLLNWRNVIKVFAQTGTTSNSRELDMVRTGALSEFANEGAANGVYQVNGTLDLSFANAADPRAACGAWTNAQGTLTPPNCIYLIGAEERFGNGDHLFTAAEQTRAADAYYYVGRGEQNFTGPGRRVRLGFEVRF